MVRNKIQIAPWSGQLLMGGAILALGYGLYLTQGPILQALHLWYERVGVVMFGLLPLTAFFFYVVGQIVIFQNRHKWLRVSLNVVVFAAPLLGMLGTVLGIAAGAGQFTLTNGVSHLLGVVTG